jgi:hypothetical protein
VFGLVAIIIFSTNLEEFKLSSTYLIKGLLCNLKRGFSTGVLSRVPLPPAITVE